MSLEDQQISQQQHIKQLLQSENWELPKWFTADKVEKIRKYKEHFSFHLKTRYIDLENEFRSVLGNFPEQADVVTASRIAQILQLSKAGLEGKTELLNISTSLDLVERYMVWLYPLHVARARAEGILIKLHSLSFNGRDALVTKLTKLIESNSPDEFGRLRSLMDEAIGTINQKAVQDRINGGLQVNRLKSFRLGAFVSVIVFLVASPLAINSDDLQYWPSESIFSDYPWVSFSPWLNSLAIMLMGALGGFLSGLLHIRNTRITLTEFLEDIYKSHLRLLVGAIIALTSYTFLSWKVLPGITVTNAGSYFFIAFLSGFSERYFLRLLKIEPDAPTEEKSLLGNSSQPNRTASPS